jgi:hypothetical protein
MFYVVRGAGGRVWFGEDFAKVFIEEVGFGFRVLDQVVSVLDVRYSRVFMFFAFNVGEEFLIISIPRDEILDIVKVGVSAYFLSIFPYFFVFVFDPV